MLKNVLISLFVFTTCNKAEAYDHQYSSPRDSYIMHLRLKLAALHAEETVLKNTLQLSEAKFALLKPFYVFESIHFLSSMTKSSLINETFAFWLRNGYCISAMIYCSLRIIRYMYIRHTIENIEKELDSIKV